jgi:hypothetical protein
MFIQKRDNLPYNLSAIELNNYFASAPVIIHKIDYQLNVLDKLQANDTVTNRLYIEKTIKSPDIYIPPAENLIAV